MALKQTQSFSAYGFVGGTASIFPDPVVENRAPTTQDQSDIGRLWVYPASNAAYILTSITSGSSNWQLLESSGGVGNFTSLTVSPGPSTLNGTVSLSTDAVAATVSVGTGAAAKAVTVGSTTTTSATTIQSGATGSISINSHGGALGILSGTGAIDISSDATDTAINIGRGLGAKTIVLGSSTTTSATTIASGSGGISIDSSNGALDIISGTGALSISDDAAATAVNVGTGAAAKTVIVGSTTAGSTLTLNTATGSPVVALNGVDITGVGAVLTLQNGTTVSDGAGAPSATLPAGSLYLNTTGSGVNDRAYISLGGGTWTAIVTVA